MLSLKTHYTYMCTSFRNNKPVQAILIPEFSCQKLSKYTLDTGVFFEVELIQWNYGTYQVYI